MSDRNKEWSSDEFLLLKFNERDELSFSAIYSQMFDELNHYAERLFYCTGVEAEDLIQDIFVTIWSNKKVKFVSLDHIRNYIYMSVRNKHKDFLKHKMHTENYSEQVKNLEDYQFSMMVETETVSILTMMEHVLPAECAKVLKLFMEGYDVKEIADQLGKSQYTVYHQRQEAVSTLKKYAFLKKITFFFTFF